MSRVQLSGCVGLALLAASLVTACEKPDAPGPDSQHDNAAAKSANVTKLDAKRSEPASPEPASLESPSPEPASPEQVDAKPITLTLGDAKIMPKAKPDEPVELSARGVVRLGNPAQDTWRISSDGKVTSASGKPVAEVAGDGSLTIGGKVSGIKLDAHGLRLSAPNGRIVTMTFADDGSIDMEPLPAPDMEMTAEGCSGPVVMTCALVLSLYLLVEPEAAPAKPGAPAKPAPPSPK